MENCHKLLPEAFHEWLHTVFDINKNFLLTDFITIILFCLSIHFEGTFNFYIKDMLF